MKHTPGPWVSGPDIEDLLSFAERIRQVIQSASPQFGMQPHVATVAGLNQSNEEIEANARLIAAAPELLQALRETLSCIDSHTGDPVVGPIIELARTAIQKATGGK